MQNYSDTELIKLTVVQSINLLNSAELLAKNQQYAIATSLIILAGEEITKTYALWHKINFPEITLLEFEKYFIDHKTKLNQAQELVILLNFKRYNPHITEQLVQAKNKSKEEINNLFKEEFGKFTNNPKYTETQQQLDWWGKAKKLKEKGLYVSNNSNPNEITQKIYEEAKNNVLRVFIPIVKTIDEMNKNKDNYKTLLKDQKELIQKFKGNK